jgi:tripartite-type tricarboxylate transporter receptor subunit TctC
MLTLGACGKGAEPVQATPDYYKGKTITWVVSSGPGGGSDLIAKALAPYLTKYLPGNPRVEFEYKDGGAGVEAANYLANVAKKDGLTVSTASQEALIAQVLGTEGVQYDFASFEFLGNFIADDQMLIIRSDFGITDLDDFISSGKIAKVGARSASHPVARLPLVLQAVVGKQLFDPTYGYSDSDEITLDVERGALQGRSISVGTLETTHPEWISDGFIVPLVYAEPERHPDFPDVPSIKEIATPATEELLELMWAPERISRSFATAPGTPADIVAVLVEAFQKMADDPDLQKDISETLGFPFRFTTAADLDKAADDILNNQDLRDRMKALVTGE